LSEKVRAGVLRALSRGMNAPDFLSLFPPDKLSLKHVCLIVAWLRDNRNRFWLKNCTAKPTLKEAILLAQMYYATKRNFSENESLRLGNMENPRAVLFSALTGFSGDSEKRMRSVLALPEPMMRRE